MLKRLSILMLFSILVFSCEREDYLIDGIEDSENCSGINWDDYTGNDVVDPGDDEDGTVVDPGDDENGDVVDPGDDENSGVAGGDVDGASGGGPSNTPHNKVLLKGGFN